ncbi:MAG TPA: tRNA (adenosine(37)-N6)-threonylcarbamoyltransferase complex dimerization subunit type 1 TsaB [Dongiaceae bacterium]
MKDGETILAFDSSGACCSAALWAGGRIAARRLEPMSRGQAERLMPMILAAMAEAGCGFGDLTGIAVTVGPGSFTGIRVALAAARGLALAGGLPVAGITTFDAALESLPPAATAGRTVAIVMDSKRGDLFTQFYDRDRRPVSGPSILPPESVLAAAPGQPLIAAGDGVALLEPHLPAGAGTTVTAVAHIDAVHVAALAARRSPSELLPPVPLYLRPADVTVAGRKRPSPQTAPGA